MYYMPFKNPSVFDFTYDPNLLSIQMTETASYNDIMNKQGSD
jgi:hypothetical protein